LAYRYGELNVLDSLIPLARLFRNAVL